MRPNAFALFALTLAMAPVLPGCTTPDVAMDSPRSRETVLLDDAYDLGPVDLRERVDLSIPSTATSARVEVTRSGTLLGLAWTFAGCGGDDGGQIAIESTTRHARGCSPVATGTQTLDLQAGRGTGRVHVLVTVVSTR